MTLIGTVTSARGDEDAASQKAIRQVRDKLYDAAIRRDRQEVAQLLADDYLGVSHDGARMKKADRLRIWVDPNSALLSHSITGSTIRIRGDLAFESCRANFSTQGRDGRQYGGSAVETNVYRKEGDAWVVCWQQATLGAKLAPEKSSGQHTYWGHTAGSFRKAGGKEWVEDVRGGHYTFVETGRNAADYVELHDDSRNCTVRLHDTYCEVKGPWTNLLFKDAYDGEWGSD
jgi:ketosteroid isomerase-like protein